MEPIRITGFAGVVPRRGARLLENNQAQVAVNCRLTSGYAASLNQPLLRNSPGVDGLQTIYRLEDAGTDYWLTWAKDIDVARGPIAGDTSQRTYFTGDNEPRVTNLALATSAAPYPTASYVLGVYPPSTAPTVGHTGGAAANITRAYVYTFKTQWGEESAPSPAGSHTAPSDATSWDLSAMQVAPANTFAVTGASWSGGVATVTMASSFGLRVGEEVIVSAVNPTGYNGTVVITEVNAGNIKYAVASNPGAYVSGGTITRVAAHNTASMTKCIYRTLTGTTDAEFQFVAEIAVATTTYADSIADSALGEVMSQGQTLNGIQVLFEMPPTDMRGLISLPNGIMAGFSKNELCLSEPFRPHAWPTVYRQATDVTIVGLGSFDTTIVVCTEGPPYVCTGTEPATMRLSLINQPWPCQAKRGIANMGFGVVYPAPQGLVLIGVTGSEMVTKEMYTQEEWKPLMPDTFIAAHYAGRYVATYDDGLGPRRMLIIDKSEFASVQAASVAVASLWGDVRTGKLYVVIEDEIYEWDADTGQRMLMDWLSKEIVLARPVNIGAAKVDADFNQSEEEIAAAQAAGAIAIAANAALIAALDVDGSINSYSVNALAINGSNIRPLPSVTWDSMTFQIFESGELKYSKTITSSRAFKLPSGYKGDSYAFRIAGNITVKSIVVAETMDALRRA